MLYNHVTTFLMIVTMQFVYQCRPVFEWELHIQTAIFEKYQAVAVILQFMSACVSLKTYYVEYSSFI